MATGKVERATALLQGGVRQFQQGEFEKARRSCEEALKFAPRNPDALHLLGVIALQNGKPAVAVERLEQAVAIRADNADYYAHLAYGYVALNRLPQALSAFERAASYRSSDPDFQIGIGNCLAMMGRVGEAEIVLRRLVERRPEHPLAWFNLANAVKDQKRYEEARDFYVRATQLAPRMAEAHCNLGYALHKLGHFEEAEQAYRACLAQQPTYMPAHVSRAINLNSQRRHEEAEAICRQALAREPGQKNLWPVLGKALTGLRRWREALQCHERAIIEFPESSDAWGDLGEALAHVGRMREALDAFDRAYEFGNVSDIVHFLKATTLFALGRIGEGAVAYLGRHDRSTFVEAHPDMPLAWELPEHLPEHEVGVIGEQGLGDEIFFLRYAPLLKARGCRICYCGNRKITDMLQRSGLFERVESNYGCVASADFRILVGDLPHLLGEAESQRPGLPPPLALSPLPERIASVRARLQLLGPPPYTGVTWRAGTGPQDQSGHVWFLFKDIPLESLAAVLREVPGTLISLQRKPLPRETERLTALVGRPVHDLSDANEDLEEMLALLAVLNDYVGVSNTNMHLRASVGRTARVLVPWPAEWRWMLAGDESPWFPGFRIYRQRLDGDWGDALKRLAADLRG